MKIIPMMNMQSDCNSTLDCVFFHPITREFIESYSVPVGIDCALKISLRQLEIAQSLSDEPSKEIEDDILAYRWLLSQPKQVKEEYRKLRQSSKRDFPIRKLVMLIRGKDKS